MNIKKSSNFNTAIDKYLEKNSIDFIDFGASNGGSIDFAIKSFTTNGKGIGLDIDENKLKGMKNKGYLCFYADIVKLDLKNKVSFIIMAHFLEHLSGYEEMKTVIGKGIKNSNNFLYIQHPNFDADGYLAEKGLKLYWSDWVGHTNHATVLQFYRILEDFRLSGDINRFAIYGYNRIFNSENDMIHPINSGFDNHLFSECVYPKKEKIVFSRDVHVYQEIRIVIAKKENIDIDKLARKFYWDRKIFDSK